MNVEHLRAVLDSVVADNKKQQLTAMVQRVSDTYAQTFQNPTADSAKAFDAAKQELWSAVESGHSVRLAPSSRAILERLGAADLLGSGLLEKVDSIVMSTETPAAKVSHLLDLRQRAEKFTQTAIAMRDAMVAVKIEASPIPPDLAEVEVRIPANLIDGSLGGLAIEAKRLDFALRDVAECATGSRPVLRIRSLASGSLEIFVTVDPQAGAEILTLITAIITLITTILQLRQNRASYAQAGTPQELLKALQDLEEKKRDETLEQLAEGLLTKLEEKKDKHRRNEIDDSVRRSVKYLADGIDKGMEINVAVLPSSASAEEPTQDGASATSADRAKWLIMQAMQESRRIERRTEPVLALPPLQAEPNSDEDGPPDSHTSAKTKKGK